jgi:hypothetical protein
MVIGAGRQLWLLGKPGTGAPRPGGQRDVQIEWCGSSLLRPGGRDVIVIRWLA